MHDLLFRLGDVDRELDQEYLCHFFLSLDLERLRECDFVRLRDRPDWDREEKCRLLGERDLDRLRDREEALPRRGVCRSSFLSDFLYIKRSHQISWLKH